MRDLTCRFPNCDVPAEFCDIDHSVAWPLGPTHASNLNAKCRKHHLLKTFWTGKAGWSEVQLPDGRIVMTSPAGKVYTTVPGSWALFPDWNTTTADVMSSYKPPQSVEPPQPVDPQGRGLQMPRRKRRRVIEEACRIRAERALNDAYVAERNKPPPY